jgi:cyanophycinase
MIRIGAGLLVGLCLALSPITLLAQGAPKSSGPPSGSLLIIGGGVCGSDILAAAARLSGGDIARWVVIPTAGDETVRRSNLASWLGQSFTLLDDWNHSQANSEAFVAPLRTATAVFFGGGRQWRLVDAYAGTLTERELRGVLDRGGLIAGTSAGATIQGSYLVRGALANNHILMSPGHERGFGYLTNVAIDQHVVALGREKDLAQVVAAHPELLGIGIDEGTAVIVQRNTMTVVGRSVVLITTATATAGQPLYTLKAGDRFDLATWTKVPPGS